MSVFPLSLGAVHSRATLKPQVSEILTLAGGPGSSANTQGSFFDAVIHLNITLNAAFSRGPYFMTSSTFLLTDNLEGERSLVLKVVHLHAHLVFSRVVSLGGTDEQDAVSFGAADVHPPGVQRLPILQPADHGFGFALSWVNKKRARIGAFLGFASCIYSVHLRSTSAYREGDGQVDLSSDVGDVPLPEEARQTDLGTI